MLALALTTAALAHPCRARLPYAPALPAPIVLVTSCGAFRAGRDGHVVRLPRHWLARHGGGTGRRWEAKVDIRFDRSRRYLLLENGRVVWRSHGPATGGSLAFGPGEFAYGDYRRGVFLTDLRSPERLVVAGRGLYPYDFTRYGDLIVVAGTRIVLVSRAGRVVARLRYRARNGFAFDERTDTLFYAAPDGRLARVRNRHVLLGHLLPLDGGVSLLAADLLVLAGAHALAATTLDGTVVARAAWPAAEGSISGGAVVSPDHRFLAFATGGARAGAKHSTVTLRVLRLPGGVPQTRLRIRLGPTGCAPGENLTWGGDALLVSAADGTRLLVEPRTGRVTDLAALARSLPRRSPDERAVTGWRSDYR